MHTLTFWHFSLPIQYAVIAAAFLVALIVGLITVRQRDIALTDTLFDLLWLSLLAARMGFVALYFDYYRDNLWSIFNIRDGGFNWIFGVAGAVLVLVYKFAKYPVLRRPLLPALFAGLFSFAAMHAVVILINTRSPSLPDLDLVTLDGENKRLSVIATKRPLVMNLWASWCPPCVREMPVLAQAQVDHPEVVFILINQGENAATIAAFLARNNINIDNVFVDIQHQFGQKTNSVGLPTTLFYNAAGQRVHIHVGELSAATLAYGMSFF